MNPLRGKTMIASAMSLMVRPIGRRRLVGSAPAAPLSTGTSVAGSVQLGEAGSDDAALEPRVSLHTAPMSYTLIGW
ncbi:hypothetical protein [Kribbella sp. NPDC051718]|uniref:hypothetical protein n=1 Tax=Kribbella sp. NPDC051718 TaxID=3155168 RepID=UPI0034240D9F